MTQYSHGYASNVQRLTCHWTRAKGWLPSRGEYNTACGATYEMPAGSGQQPRQAGFIFCPNCGQKIEC